MLVYTEFCHATTSTTRRRARPHTPDARSENTLPHTNATPTMARMGATYIDGQALAAGLVRAHALVIRPRRRA
ncbi:hypothetical protein STSO111631_16115 [Stackebrandtia soli]